MKVIKKIDDLKVIDKKVYYFKKKGLQIIYNQNFAPLNMAKTWLLAEKFYEKADKYAWSYLMSPNDFPPKRYGH